MSEIWTKQRAAQVADDAATLLENSGWIQQKCREQLPSGEVCYCPLGAIYQVTGCYIPLGNTDFDLYKDKQEDVLDNLVGGWFDPFYKQEVDKLAKSEDTKPLYSLIPRFNDSKKMTKQRAIETLRRCAESIRNS